jgi:hypothetical protein
MASQILNNQINKYAKKLHFEKSGCSFVSGAEYYKHKKVAHSGDIEKKDFVKSLKVMLEKFGKIGDKYNKSSIGFCAETVSVNRVLKKYPKNLSDLKVGIAIRPKTLQAGKKCKICKSIF